MEKIIQNLEELENLVTELFHFAGDRRKFLFFGEIGAGKTTFIQMLCKQLGVQDKVTSPTFSLVNEYPFSKNGREEYVHHLDLYRLKNTEEAIDIGIEEYLDDPWYCLIEWPEIIEPLWPIDPIKIKIEILEDSSRKILFL